MESLVISPAFNIFIIFARAAYFVMHIRPQARTENVQQPQSKLLPRMLPKEMLAKEITEAWKQVWLPKCLIVGDDTFIIVNANRR